MSSKVSGTRICAPVSHATELRGIGEQTEGTAEDQNVGEYQAVAQGHCTRLVTAKGVWHRGRKHGDECSGSSHRHRAAAQPPGMGGHKRPS